MVFDIHEVTGIGDYTTKVEKGDTYYYVPDGKAFLVVRNNTIEVRTDSGLGRFLREKYESVMESRYFGRGGIEIVMSGQLEKDEVYDLVRLSYNLTKE
ncbi:hypothetical protein IJK16_02630 [Candidatus Saccharibacteria bacterium]|nr:hypothetical protein [Candidatus Saccharibacteria bacterium]